MPAVARGRAAGKSAKVWRDALDRALTKRIGPNEDSPRRLEAVAEACVAAAISGDVMAIREIGDRIDGKSAQQIIHVGDDDADPIRIARVERLIVDATATAIAVEEREENAAD